MRTRQIIVGGLAWIGVAAGATVAVRSQFAEKPQGFADVVSGIGRWVSGAPEEHLAESAVDLVLAPGDPIFLKAPDGRYQQVGRVRFHFPDVEQLPDASPFQVNKAAYTRKASVVLYDDILNRAFPDGFQLEYHTTPTALEWVVQTMMTPERQKEITQIIARDWEKHRAEIVARLQPVVETGIAKAVGAIEAELPKIIRTHQSDFARLADRYQTEIIRSQIVPLVRQEILPIVQEEVRPIVTEIGKDLWNRVSVWSFTWRYLYDKSPLPEKNAVKLEFDRFLKEEVTPALESRTEKFVTVTERILRRISRNEKVRFVIRENLKKVVTDEELQKIVWDVVQEAVVENQKLKDSLRAYWASAEVQNAMAIASTSFEPTAREIGDTLFGSRETGITPEFSRVLRAQILMKDRRWFVVVPKPSGPALQPQPEVSGVVMFPALETMPYPIEFEGMEQSPLTQLENPE